ncbi:hypothetical protein YC2023_113047 [Brassica napus]
MLFINSIFSYVITRFADHSELQSPCLMCSQQQMRQGIGLRPLWVRVLCMIKKKLESCLFRISVCYCSTSTIGHKNRLNHQKLENCEPERKAADFRLSTRPFLSLVEKKWLAFQLLLAVKQCHEKDICHGDIKCENVLVTSGNWLSFFYDTRERRLCYLAQEVL